MPKRPCSVKLIEKDDDKNTVIICADKFGDVYSLPLFTSPKAPQPTAEAAKKKDEKRPNNNNPNSKNLGPLTKQEKMAMISRDSLANLEQKELPFENTLLLGHVSLLIDVVPVTVNVDGKERTFILSADKDEHIRISRFPQAYVIEGFCLGHKM